MCSYFYFPKEPRGYKPDRERAIPICPKLWSSDFGHPLVRKLTGSERSVTPKPEVMHYAVYKKKSLGTRNFCFYKENRKNSVAFTEEWWKAQSCIRYLSKWSNSFFSNSFSSYTKKVLVTKSIILIFNSFCGSRLSSDKWNVSWEIFRVFITISTDTI